MQDGADPDEAAADRPESAWPDLDRDTAAAPPPAGDRSTRDAEADDAELTPEPEVTKAEPKTEEPVEAKQ
ncbi:MAG TPA: hypothetical protein VGG05_02860, partial [Pseudonocardiaceae bacterium]